MSQPPRTGSGSQPQPQSQPLRHPYPVQRNQSSPLSQASRAPGSINAPPPYTVPSPSGSPAPFLQHQDSSSSYMSDNDFNPRPNRRPSPESNSTNTYGQDLRFSTASSNLSTGSGAAPARNPFRDPQSMNPSMSSVLSRSASSGMHNSSLNSRRGGYRGGPVTNKFSLHPDPNLWGYDVSPHSVEDDDWLHKPEKGYDVTGNIWHKRGFMNLGFIFLLALGFIWVFLVSPLKTGIEQLIKETKGWGAGFNLGGINSTGQLAEGFFAMVDHDTPQEALTKISPADGRQMTLVFSDEFETPGRTFFPGDDPFWEAADLYYWGTNDMEYYDPKQVYTQDGKLVLEFRQEPNRNLSYLGGMLTSWNKFCFTGGLVEASVQLPGSPEISGFWPAIWTMGNLGRAGYGATTEGLWPYSYEACDIGTMPNQTRADGFPHAQELEMGDIYSEYFLSFLPGQRLSACTCPGEEHPGPVHDDGHFTGRACPEIDMFEAQIDGGLGHRGGVSESAQFAPFNAYYHWKNETYATYYMEPGVTQHLNTYPGGVYQQASSVVALTNQGCYEMPSAEAADPGCYSVYGFQYKPGYESDGGHITWINDNKLSWKLDAAGMGADERTGISDRPISKEPMYIIANLGMARGFAPDLDESLLTFPAHMRIDWIRVYQYDDEINYGCDPPNYPTNNYINRFIEAYTNPNITTWSNPKNKGGYEQAWPKNSLVGSGCD